MEILNPEDIMLSEISQSQNDEYCMISFIWGTQSSQIHWNRKVNGGCRGRGAVVECKNGELLFKWV